MNKTLEVNIHEVAISNVDSPSPAGRVLDMSTVVVCMGTPTPHRAASTRLAPIFLRIYRNLFHSHQSQKPTSLLVSSLTPKKCIAKNLTNYIKKSYICLIHSEARNEMKINKFMEIARSFFFFCIYI